MTTIPNDVASDGIIPNARVFVTSNGPDRNLPDASEFGELTPILRTRIDEHLHFNKLKTAVSKVMQDFNEEEDFILIGSSSIVLMLVMTEILLYQFTTARVLSYDHLTRSFQQYTLSNDGQWTTTIPTAKAPLSS